MDVMDQKDSPLSNSEPTGSGGLASNDMNSVPQSFNEALDSYNEISGNGNGQSYEQRHGEHHSGMNSPTPGDYREDSIRSEDRPVYENPGTTLYVSKLAYKTSEETLYQEFAKYGKLHSCNLVVDPHTKESRGFAFVTFEGVEDADNAIANSQDLRIDGATLFVEKSRRCRPRSPTPGRYSGTKPLMDRRFGSYTDRRDMGRPPMRDHYDRPPMRYPHERDYPPRDAGYGPPRDRILDYPSRYGLKEPFPDHRVRDRAFERPLPPRGREYYSRSERAPYPPRDPRDVHPAYSRDPRELRDAREPREFRAPRELRDPRDPRDPRERYSEYPRARDPREIRESRPPPPPFDRERAPIRPREEPIPDRYREERDRGEHYPPARAAREHRPRYDY